MVSRRQWLQSSGLGVVAWALGGVPARAEKENERPNILWLSCEDIGPLLGCYGDPLAKTPHLDKLASEGVLYSHAYTTAGVCAPCRSGIITGIIQTTLGTQHMRCQAKLPDFIKPFPLLLRQAGYYCTNNSKKDYQFSEPVETWDESSKKAHWRERKDKRQPFFSVFNFTGCHESGIGNAAKYESVVKGLTRQDRDEAARTLPPYYPNTPVTREDWGRYYDVVQAMDRWVGDLLSQLEEDGLAEETIVMFWSDHGVGLPRAKRWLYESGTHVPLIVRIPSRYRRNGQGEPGTVADQLVSSIDLGPTVLNLAGVPVPSHMQGEPFLGEALPAPRSYIFGARDRMDERYDIIRMVRDQRYRYIRNYEPLKPYYQYMNTPEKGATMRELRRLHEAGQLPLEAELFWAKRKPVEELYDVEKDPHEIHNLAENESYREILERMRRVHLDWVKASVDLGLVPEPELAAREGEIGSRYAILRQERSDALVERLRRAAFVAGEGDPESIDELTEALHDEDAAVRYWGATGLGNLGHASRGAEKVVAFHLNDPSPAVRVASARALCRMRRPNKALPVLAEVLKEGEQWERLQAAIVLDEIDEMARPVMDVMNEALTPREKLYAKGKYVVRVLNRALNELLGTNRQVR